MTEIGRNRRGFLSRKNRFLKNPFSFRNSIIGRYLDDAGTNAVYSAWYRFMSMDDLYREWGQPYYALNPGTGKQNQLFG